MANHQMNRKKFISTCSKGSLILLGGGMTLLHSCIGTQYITGQLEGSNLIVPLAAFQTEKDGKINYKKYVIAQHESLQYPICIYRDTSTDYRALLMKCTHQGAELQVFGDRLQCPAHGSEFTKDGAVQNGPADTSLRSFPVVIENEILKINLS